MQHRDFFKESQSKHLKEFNQQVLHTSDDLKMYLPQRNEKKICPYIFSLNLIHDLLDWLQGRVTSRHS